MEGTKTTLNCVISFYNEALRILIYQKNILFVCTMNLQRSRTAEDLYKDDPRFKVKSVGTDINAINRINLLELEWADFIIVMEKYHRNKIRKEFPEIYFQKRIISLYIADEFDYMEEELIRLLKFNFEKIYIEEIFGK